MAKFFVPFATDDKQAEDVWASVRTFLASQGYPTTERRIQKVYFRHNSKHYEAEVGRRFADLREDAIVILEADGPELLYLCTANRGVARGGPYLIGARDSGTHVVDFANE